MLGSIVSELVGDEAEVSVIIPDGQDPHDFEPSAKDIEKLNEADLVVANGLGFEEGLLDALDSAHDRGVERFLVSDFVTTLDGEGHAHAHHSTDTSGDHGDDGAAIDPHVWLSPFAMSEMVDDLGAAITTATGLDVSIHAQTLNVLEDLQARLGLTYVFVAHDLSVVQHVSTRVAVMYVGRIVELAPTADLFFGPRHPYSEALLSAVPTPDPLHRGQRIFLAGEVPDASNPPPGCHFHPRCRYAIEACKVSAPPLTEVGAGHFVACHRATELSLIGVTPGD